MAASQEIGSATATIEHAGAIDLLIGVAGPVNEDELRARAAESLPGLALPGGGPTAWRVAVAFPVAGPAQAATAAADSGSGLRFLSYPLSSSATPALPWLAAPAAYREIARLAERTGARACVVLGQDLGALNQTAIEALARPLMDGNTMLSAPLYPAGKYEGLLNSGMLYPFARSLYGRRIRHPFAVDFGVAGAMIATLSGEAVRGQGHPVVCPVVDGAAADLRVVQSHMDVRHVAHHDGLDLSTVLGTLAGALFEGAEKNAAAWQRMRGSQPTPVFGSPSPAVNDIEAVDVRPLIESFNLASHNLQEIWGLVLPPVTLLELKRLSRLPAEQFRMPDLLWAKVVYDFALAHRLHSISRTHLLGALTPLYLGWVASYAAEVQMADAAAFEEGKPYFVSRWRWPDRFNP